MNQQVRITAGAHFFGKKGTIVQVCGSTVFVAFARNTKDGLKTNVFSFPASYVTAI